MLICTVHSVVPHARYFLHRTFNAPVSPAFSTFFSKFREIHRPALREPISSFLFFLTTSKYNKRINFLQFESLLFSNFTFLGEKVSQKKKAIINSYKECLRRSEKLFHHL